MASRSRVLDQASAALAVGIVFVSDNPAYDFQWINFYFWRYFGQNPIGHSNDEARLEVPLDRSKAGASRRHDGRLRGLLVQIGVLKAKPA